MCLTGSRVIASRYMQAATTNSKPKGPMKATDRVFLINPSKIIVKNIYLF